MNWFEKNLKGDPVIWLVVACLAVFSVLVVYSAVGTLAYKQMDGNTEYYLFKHSLLMIVAFVAMYAAHLLDYRYYSKISRLLLLISIPILLGSWLFGPTINEANRWLTIPYINQSFQPSDLAKLALIANLAAMLSKRQQFIDDLKESFLPMVLWSALICGLIALSNFSTAVMLFLTCMLIMYIGRVPAKYLGMLVVVGALACSIALFAGQRGPTVKARIDRFISGEVSFQSEQAYIAMANGGVFGLGPGNSMQKDFLPHPYSDFIYAIILEEYGLIGGIVILLLYLTLLWRGLVTVSKSSNAFGGLLAAGLGFSLVIQAILNMAVVSGLVPVTGQPMPLVSMGGTSLIFTGLSLGIMLSVSRGEIDTRLKKTVARNVQR